MDDKKVLIDDGNNEKSELDTSKKSDTLLYVVLFSVLVVVLAFVVFAVNNHLENNAIGRIIEKNNLENFIDAKTVKEVSKIDLDSDVLDLPSGYSLVLLYSDDNDQYTLALVNYSDEQMQLFDYGDYFPLNVIVDNYISHLSNQEQIEHLSCLADYINEYGVDCFNNRDIAESYIKETENFYNVEDARTMIESSALFRIPNSQNISDFKVIFEGETAVPLYYAFMTKSIERNPKWGYIDVDSLYGVQIDYLAQIFGPVYIERETWHAYSRDFNLMDRSFKSDTYKELEKALLDTHEVVYGSINRK